MIHEHWLYSLLGNSSDAFAIFGLLLLNKWPYVFEMFDIYLNELRASKCQIFKYGQEASSMHG